MVVHSTEGSNAFFTPQMLERPHCSPLKYDDALINSTGDALWECEMTNEFKWPNCNPLKFNNVLMNSSDALPDNWEMTNESKWPNCSLLKFNDVLMNSSNVLPDREMTNKSKWSNCNPLEFTSDALLDNLEITNRSKWPYDSPSEFNDILMNSRDALPENWVITNDSPLEFSAFLMNSRDALPDNWETTNESDWPLLWSSLECIDAPMNRDNPLPDYSEVKNEKNEVFHTSRGLTNSQTNQHQLNQVTIYEAPNRTKSGCRKVKLTPDQKKERKRETDRKFREKRKSTAAEQTAEIGHLKRRIEELNDENKTLKESLQTCHGQLPPAEAPQRQRDDACIAQYTTKQSDHPNVSVEVATVSGLEMNGSQNLLQKIPINAVATNDDLTENQKNSRTGTCYDYDNTTIKLLMKEIDEDDESNVCFSDFKGLNGERKKIGKYNFPLSLIPVVERIIDCYGDVSATSKMNLNAVEATYILFCASVKEMGDLQLEEVTKDRILKWRDTIKDALRINFKVDFAMDHLKKIAHAYVGRIQSQELNNMTESISKLEADLNTKKEEFSKRKELSKKCMDAAEEFNGKSLSLFT